MFKLSLALVFWQGVRATLFSKQGAEYCLGEGFDEDVGDDLLSHARYHAVITRRFPKIVIPRTIRQQFESR